MFDHLEKNGFVFDLSSLPLVILYLTYDLSPLTSDLHTFAFDLLTSGYWHLTHNILVMTFDF